MGAYAPRSKKAVSFITNYESLFCQYALWYLDYHFLEQTSGPETWKDTTGIVDMKNPSIKIVCVKPSESTAISCNPLTIPCGASFKPWTSNKSESSEEDYTLSITWT